MKSAFKLKKVKYGYGIFVNGRQIRKTERDIYDPVSFGFVDMEVEYTFESNETDAWDWMEDYFGIDDDIFYYISELNHLIGVWKFRNDCYFSFALDEYRSDNDIVKKMSWRDYYNLKRELVTKIKSELERVNNGRC